MYKNSLRAFHCEFLLQFLTFLIKKNFTKKQCNLNRNYNELLCKKMYRYYLQTIYILVQHHLLMIFSVKETKLINHILIKLNVVFLVLSGSPRYTRYQTQKRVVRYQDADFQRNIQLLNPIPYQRY